MFVLAVSVFVLCVCVCAWADWQLKLVCKMAAIYIWPGVVCTCHTDFCRLEINRILLSNRKRRAFRKLKLRCHGNAKTSKHTHARIPKHRGGSILKIRVIRKIKLYWDLFRGTSPETWKKNFIQHYIWFFKRAKCYYHNKSLLVLLNWATLMDAHTHPHFRRLTDTDTECYAVGGLVGKIP